MTFNKYKEIYYHVRKEIKNNIIFYGKPVMEYPPSTQIVCPVIYDAVGKHKNATNDETSPTCPGRFIGVRQIIRLTSFNTSTSLYTLKKMLLLIIS